MFSFDLASEPWIPCQLPDTISTGEYSLHDVIVHAAGIRAISHPSPLITAAIHRLIIAVLHDIFGPRTDNEWLSIWEQRAFDSQAVGQYFTRNAGNFDLFHPVSPFYQRADLPESVARPVAKLGPEFSSGNNGLLFDHSSDERPKAMHPAKAARYLLALQAFAVGGLVSFLPGESAHRSAFGGPLVKCAVGIVAGENLFQTLALNLIRVDGRDDTPFPFDPAADRPAWRAAGPTEPADRRPLGYLDYLTWQSRRVRLFPEMTDAGPVVRRAAILKGYQVPAGAGLVQYETMAAFTRNLKATASQDPFPPLGFRPERALWRDAEALFRRSAKDEFKQIAAVEAVAERLDWIAIEPRLSLFGLSSDRAKIFLWRAEQLPLPKVVLNDSDAMTYVTGAITRANEGRDAISAAARRLAVLLLASDESPPDPKRVRALTDSWAADRAYWADLGLAFNQFLDILSRDRAVAATEWNASVRRAARNAFEPIAKAAETSGRGLRAASEARGLFFVRLAKIPQAANQEGTTI